MGCVGILPSEKERKNWKREGSLRNLALMVTKHKKKHKKRIMVLCKTLGCPISLMEERNGCQCEVHGSDPPQPVSHMWGSYVYDAR